MNRSNIKSIACISVDNTKTFEDKNLNELYVNEWEKAAQATKELIEACRYYKITTINVLEEHPVGHISLAANYKNKNVFDLITYDEVQAWTEEDNGIGERAEFNLSELKKFLSEVGSQRLRPDHAIEKTEGVELTQPLEEEDFDLKIIKGTNPAREAYSWFDETTLDEELKKREKKILLMSWVATDYCLGKTALDAHKKWYDVYVVSETIRGVAKETTDAILQTMQDEKIQFITTKDLFALLSKYPQK